MWLLWVVPVVVRRAAWHLSSATRTTLKYLSISSNQVLYPPSSLRTNGCMFFKKDSPLKVFVTEQATFLNYVQTMDKIGESMLFHLIFFFGNFLLYIQEQNIHKVKPKVTYLSLMLSVILWSSSFFVVFANGNQVR